MKNKSIKIISILILFISVVSTTFFVLAYYFSEGKIEEDKEFGDVEVNSEIFFMNGSTKIPGIEYETIDGHKKNNVYEVTLSNESDLYFINKLRVNITVDSNIDTYFRVRIVDVLTLKLATNDGYRELTLPNEGIPYPYNQNDWFFDDQNNWFYYKTKVKRNGSNSLEIPFIQAGLAHNLLPIQYKIQFGIKIEAVQAHLGPENNWDLETKPWGGSW